MPVTTLVESLTATIDTEAAPGRGLSPRRVPNRRQDITSEAAMAQTRTRRTVHSHTRLERFRRRLFADPPWSAIPDGHHARYAVSKAIRQCWLWRDISPGPIAATLLGIVLGYGPVTWLLVAALGAAGSVWFDSNRGHTANKDRAEYRLVMRFKRAWLDAIAKMPEHRRPALPDILWTSDRDHATTLAISLVASDDGYATARAVRGNLGIAYGKVVIFDPQSDGTALIVVRKSDPLASEPELPMHLGGKDGLELEPTVNALPFGIDRDAEVFYIDLDQKHMLMGGITSSGKSSSANAMIVSDIAARYVQPYALNPDEGSFDCFKGLIPYAGTPQACLAMMRDLYELVAKRSVIRAQQGTSLLPISDEHPVIRIYIDEVQYLYDDHIHGKEFVAEFDTYVRDILNRGRKVRVNMVALATDFSRDVLDKALVRQFKVRACFHVADSYAAQIVLGEGIPNGLEPQHIPDNKPGLCTLKTGGWRQIRTFRCWDHKARQAAANLLGDVAADWPPPAPTAEVQQLHLINEHKADKVGELPQSRRLNNRTLVLRYLQDHVEATVPEIAQRTGVPERSVNYCLKEAKDRIRVEPVGGGRYRLAGGRP